jgi:hypothetical protein
MYLVAHEAQGLASWDDGGAPSKAVETNFEGYFAKKFSQE